MRLKRTCFLFFFIWKYTMYIRRKEKDQLSIFLYLKVTLRRWEHVNNQGNAFYFSLFESPGDTEELIKKIGELTFYFSLFERNRRVDSTKIGRKYKENFLFFFIWKFFIWKESNSPNKQGDRTKYSVWTFYFSLFESRKFSMYFGKTIKYILSIFLYLKVTTLKIIKKEVRHNELSIFLYLKGKVFHRIWYNRVGLSIFLYLKAKKEGFDNIKIFNSNFLFFFIWKVEFLCGYLVLLFTTAFLFFFIWKKIRKKWIWVRIGQ